MQSIYTIEFHLPCGVGVERVLVEEALRADLGRAGAREALDLLGRGVHGADLSLGGELLGAHAGAQLDVEDEGGHAGHLEGHALVTAEERRLKKMRHRFGEPWAGDKGSRNLYHIILSIPVELVADGGVLVVEEAVGARAAGVDALLGLLHEGAVAAVHVVRQLAGLVVGFAAGRIDRSCKSKQGIQWGIGCANQAG